MAQIIEYDPWGKVSREEGIGDSLRRFTGKQLDPESSLYYYGGRYYDPELGRFISPDPFVARFEDPQNLNRYSYVENNPVNYIDPSGYKKKKKGGLFRKLFGIFRIVVGVFHLFSGDPSGIISGITSIASGASSFSNSRGAQLFSQITGNFAAGFGGGPSGSSTGTSCFVAQCIPDPLGGRPPSGGVMCFAPGPGCGGFDLPGGFGGFGSPALRFGASGSWETGEDKPPPQSPLVITRIGDIDIDVFDILTVGSVRVVKTGIAGIYKVFSQRKWYIGQSKDILRRLMEHVRAGKFTRDEVEKAVIERVPGGRTAREVAEQLEIDKLGGIKGGGVLNERNPIGPNRRHLLED